MRGCDDVLGSSVSLAPTLISIYDRTAVATSGGQETEHVSAGGCSWYNDDARVKPGVAAPAATAAATRTVDIDRLATPSTASSVSPRRSTIVKRATSSTMVLPGDAKQEVDLKKRPLSIRSTSSTASTVSATQRRPRRKKQAVEGEVGCTGVDGNLAPVSERLLGQQAASYSDELDCMTSSLLQRSGSESSGGCEGGCAGGDVVRLSSLLTDDDDQEDVDVSPSSDCSDASGRSHSSGRGHHVTQSTSSQSYVDMVVAEILDTERAYVKDLRDVIQVPSVNFIIRHIAYLYAKILIYRFSK